MRRLCPPFRSILGSRQVPVNDGHMARLGRLSVVWCPGCRPLRPLPLAPAAVLSRRPLSAGLVGCIPRCSAFGGIITPATNTRLTLVWGSGIFGWRTSLRSRCLGPFASTLICLKPGLVLNVAQSPLGVRHPWRLLRHHAHHYDHSGEVLPCSYLTASIGTHLAWSLVVRSIAKWRSGTVMHSNC